MLVTGWDQQGRPYRQYLAAVVVDVVEATRETRYAERVLRQQATTAFTRTHTQHRDMSGDLCPAAYPVDEGGGEVHGQVEVG